MSKKFNVIVSSMSTTYQEDRYGDSDIKRVYISISKENTNNKR